MFLTIGRMKDRTKARRPETAIGYARVSTDERAREGVSLEAQLARIRPHSSALALGFIWTAEHYDLLGEYESNRDTYPSMTQFMHRVVSFFREFTPLVRQRLGQ